MGNEVINGVHGCSSEEQYIAPKQPEVLAKLEEFQDRKLGFMMHWAPVTQLGILESWAMVDTEASWSQREIDWTEDMDEFRKEYRELHKTFNPIRFQPEDWAKLAKECGFKYLLFTTKHHDGFCMWDTKTTEYRITSENCPFHKHPKRDIVGELYNAFRGEGLGIHTYFSKPDWDSDYYWSKDHSWPDNKTDRNPNYSIEENPELWESFVDYTHRQITELMTQYGEIDCLWLDGGWVSPHNLGQDIRLREIVEKMRATSQPGLLCSDRTVGGLYENFITPEQSIPDKPIFVPWESCITLGRSFSYHYDDQYKSPRLIIQLFIDIVAKGGNLALNITPQPDGRLPKEGTEVLRELGAFLEACGEGIYGTRVCAPYREGQYAFTKKGKKIYVFYLYEEEEEQKTCYRIPLSLQDTVSQVRCLSQDVELIYTVADDEMHITLDGKIQDTPYVDVFCIEI